MTNKIKLQCSNGLLFLKVDEIIYFKAIDNYTELYTTDGDMYLLNASLSDMEKLNEGFFRCHRSYIINLEKIVAYHNKENILLLEGNIKIPLARRRVNEFEGLLKQLV